MSVTLRLPATSANLGPGFDTLALALDLYLEVEAEAAPEFSIEATGRNSDICGALRGNLLIETYRKTLGAAGKSVGELLGGALRQDVPVYLSSLRRDTSPHEECAFLAERLTATGARAVKLVVRRSFGGQTSHE